jgi:hypothetical protein
LCFGGVFVPGPTGVIEASCNICCATVVATGLTGFVHRSDWCHRPDQLLTVKTRQPSHEFTFGVGISFIPYPLVLTPVV